MDNLENETWRDVVGYEGLYQVSNMGRVKSLKRKWCLADRILRYASARDYLIVVLNKRGCSRTKSIHKLVAESFLNHTPCGHKLVVNHIDHNKLNNSVDNLEIITTRENTNQKHRKSSSKYTGVYWFKKRGKWVSQIVINNKHLYLGIYENEIDAHNAYQAKLKEIS